MGVDLLSTRWTSAELVQWKENTITVLASFTLVVCVIAQILFYIFPRLRVFPRALISWVNLYNLSYMIVLIIKWAPQSMLHKSWVLELDPKSVLCKLGIMIDTASLIGPVCCTALVCLTMFLRVVLNVDIEGNTLYYVAFLSFATAFPLVIAVVSSYAFASDTSYAFCVTAKDGEAPIKVALVGVFILQVIFFGIAMFHVKMAFSSITSVTPSNFPMSYLVVRFSAIFVLQTIGLVPASVATLFRTSPSLAKNAIFVRFVTVTRMVGPMLDAFVLIVGNVDFIEWLKTKYLVLWKRATKYSSSPRGNTTDNYVEMASRTNILYLEQARSTDDNSEIRRLSINNEEMPFTAN